MGLLAKCPQCGVMIAKGTRCPECNFQEGQSEEETAAAGQKDAELQTEYLRREELHKKNYTIFMALGMSAGLVGVLISVLLFLMFFGGRFLRGRAFNLAGEFGYLLLLFLLIAEGVLGYFLKVSNTMFPRELMCPGCDIRVDEIGLEDGRCPGCRVKLR